MSDTVRVKIKGTVVTSRYGTLSSGDILHTDAAYAAHLVDECNAAVYIDAVQEPADKKSATKKTTVTKKAD
jgi:hypothetical protein